MRIYIIHSPNSTENYIDNVLSTEQKLIKSGENVVNPLPDQIKAISNEELHNMYASKIEQCDAVYAMENWDKTVLGNAEMAQAMSLRKTIMFEQKV